MFLTLLRCTLLEGAFKRVFQKSFIWPTSKALGIVFNEHTWRREECKCKENRYGNDYLGVFWVHMVVCEFLCVSKCAWVLWGLVLWLEHGHCGYYRDAVFWSLQSPVWTLTSASHVQTDRHTHCWASECMDICLEFLAWSGIWWSLYLHPFIEVLKYIFDHPTDRAYIFETILFFWAIGEIDKEGKQKRGRKVKKFKNKFLIWAGVCVDMHAETWRALPLCRETSSRCRFQEVFHNFCSVQLVSTDPHLSPPVSELSVFCASGQLYR